MKTLKPEKIMECLFDVVYDYGMFGSIKEIHIVVLDKQYDSLSKPVIDALIQRSHNALHRTRTHQGYSPAWFKSAVQGGHYYFMLWDLCPKKWVPSARKKFVCTTPPTLLKGFSHFFYKITSTTKRH